MDASRHRRNTVLLLLLAGALGWAALFLPLANRARVPWQVYLMLGPWGWPALVGLLAVAAALCRVAPVRAALARPGVRFRGSSLLAGIVAAAYLLATAWWPGRQRQFFPYVQDELSYLIQAQQLARFHLWYRAHPLGAFFDSFQLLTDGVYASAYFPGTALLHVPGVWLRLPPWATNLAAAGAVAGLLHWIISEMIDATAGWLAVLLLLSCQLFRTLSIMTLAQIPLLLYGLAAVACWMRWRRTQRNGWALGVGCCLGLAAITRPVDALCFGLPLALATLGALRSRRWPARAVALMLVGASPWAALQLVSNYGITGHPLTTPFRVYADRDYPGTAYGFHPDQPHAHPLSNLPEKRLSYQQDVRPLVAVHRPTLALSTLTSYRLPLTLSLGGAVTPFPLLAILLPASLLGLGLMRGRGRWTLFLTLPLFLLLYVPYAFFYPGYTLVAAPALVLSPLVAARVLPSLWPAARAPLMAGMSIVLAGLAIAALPQWDASVNDDLFDATLTQHINQQLAQIRSPAIVLFRFSANHNLNEAPVYNPDVAWPDDAMVIRAHDRGATLNQHLFRYYAARQPARQMYLYNEQDGSLHPLAPVAKLTGGL
jgi:4-amino-4-deoxy-L-arabinose transferase-like glycosyltransferase